MTSESAAPTTLRDYLETSDMTAGALAELIPCSRSYISRIASGGASPGYKMACRIEAVTYGVVKKQLWFPDREEVT